VFVYVYIHTYIHTYTRTNNAVYNVLYINNIFLIIEKIGVAIKLCTSVRNVNVSNLDCGTDQVFRGLSQSS